MSLLGFVALVLIAAIAGAIGQSLAGYSLGGCAVSAVIGFVGAYIGMWIAQQFGFPTFLAVDIGGESFPIVWSIIGSTLLTVIVGLVSRRRVRI